MIVDDGGHTYLQQQQTLAAYWGRVRAGGLFIIEDLHTSFDGRELLNNFGNQISRIIILTLRHHLPSLNKECTEGHMDLPVSTYDVLLEKQESPVFNYASVVRAQMEGEVVIMDWQTGPGSRHHTTAVLRKQR